MQSFKTILVTSNAGVGKTSLAKELSKALYIGAYSLDKVVTKDKTILYLDPTMLLHVAFLANLVTKQSVSA